MGLLARTRVRDVYVLSVDNLLAEADAKASCIRVCSDATIRML